ncbi:hypothetical protein HYV43_01265 [Candidatus Micrarchaeota archaeon]|nr:hypothetical protein [Candidatus Micrarchaeota archaeon]
MDGGTAVGRAVGAGALAAHAPFEQVWPEEHVWTNTSLVPVCGPVAHDVPEHRPAYTACARYTALPLQ